MKKEWTVNGEPIQFEVLKQNAKSVSLKFKEQVYHYSLREDGSLETDQNELIISLRAGDDFLIDGEEFNLVRSKPARLAAGKNAQGSLKSPMPGKILKIFVELGQEVDVGEPLLVLEAMKMEHTIKAPIAATVKGLPFAVGEQVKSQTELIQLQALESKELAT